MDKPQWDFDSSWETGAWLRAPEEQGSGEIGYAIEGVSVTRAEFFESDNVPLEWKDRVMQHECDQSREENQATTGDYGLPMWSGKCWMLSLLQWATKGDLPCADD